MFLGTRQNLWLDGARKYRNRGSKSYDPVVYIQNIYIGQKQRIMLKGVEIHDFFLISNCFISNSSENLLTNFRDFGKY